MDFSRVIGEATPLMLQGLRITVLISLAAIFFGIIIGLFTCLMGLSRNRLLRGIASVYIWIIRGTPMIVQAFLIFFGMPQLIKLLIPAFRLDPQTAGIITLSLNAGAYLAEIFRGGISAVDRGQTEAARSLGMSAAHTMAKVVLPQAIKIAIPSMLNQFIISVKDTSILSVIGMAELTNRAKVYVGKSYQYFATYIYVAMYYLIFISILMVISKYVEKKLRYERKDNRSRSA